MVVLGEEVIRQEEITGVLTRLPCVFKEELNYILEPDRSFVAAEMNAFLVFWLSSLKCPVINRPHLGCLNGPALSPERWMQAAARAGLSIPHNNAKTKDDVGSITSVTVVGGRCHGEGEARFLDQSCRLAHLVEVDLIEVRFAGSSFLEINLLPEIMGAGVTQAVLELFEGGQ